MKTSKDYLKNIENGIITMPMLSDCLYSVKSRAKNCRDQERYYREKSWGRYYYDQYNNEEKYR